MMVVLRWSLKGCWIGDTAALLQALQRAKHAHDVWTRVLLVPLPDITGSKTGAGGRALLPGVAGVQLLETGGRRGHAGWHGGPIVRWTTLGAHAVQSAVLLLRKYLRQKLRKATARSAARWRAVSRRILGGVAVWCCTVRLRTSVTGIPSLVQTAEGPGWHLPCTTTPSCLLLLLTGEQACQRSQRVGGQAGQHLLQLARTTQSQTRF